MVPLAAIESEGARTRLKHVMKTYHIHIGGLVQGVGFRPHVFRLAMQHGLNGWVSNAKDGVHIECNASEESAQQFYSGILAAAPVNAVITSHTIAEIKPQAFVSFTIREGEVNAGTDLLLTPDFGMCASCRNEVLDSSNRRYHYPFTTCLQCGPRYSIIRELPYERSNTSMAALKMCPVCNKEYFDVGDDRYYSQTNSCPACAIPMHLYDAAGVLLSSHTDELLHQLNTVLLQGAVAAVKGIGGYLLLCDAGNAAAVQQLRQRKHRPAKPFALLYADINFAKEDVIISRHEEAILKSKASPIVLCRLRDDKAINICAAGIAPGLGSIGLMLPCSPLLLLVAGTFGKPLVATSANISGSPIISDDQEALELLHGIADYVVTYDRDIVMPQDDSVLQVTATGRQIILRRGRGLSPGYFPNPLADTPECLLAMGAELKSAFAIQHKQQLFISQFLGNQENVASQFAYDKTLHHLLQLLQMKPDMILVDKHPGYFVSEHGKEIAAQQGIPYISIQHHKAHFGAVLAENNLLCSREPVLGVIWDGTGYGDDEQVWGGEFFLLENAVQQRVAQLEYFPQLLGDKMSREPRLSALSMLKFLPERMKIMQSRFSVQEWKYYSQLISQPADLLTSSMGRFLDGIASMAGICDINSYEGEAAMKLEALARKCNRPWKDYYPVPLKNNRLDFSLLLQELTDDVAQDKARDEIAQKVFYSLAHAIRRVSEHFNTRKITFSGGVFQNALLADMITDLMGGNNELYWHRQLSPNDECIAFGQLACYQLLRQQQQEEKLQNVSVLIN